MGIIEEIRDAAEKEESQDLLDKVIETIRRVVENQNEQRALLEKLLLQQVHKVHSGLSVIDFQRELMQCRQKANLVNAPYVGSNSRTTRR